MNQIAYLGPEGTFGHEAAKIWSPNASYVAFRSHLHILDAVEKGDVADGIVAIENSIDGPVTDVIDYFIHDALRTRVCGEIVVPINQCLFAKPGVSLENVRMVISHSKGLGQCAKSIHRQFPTAQQVEVDSTAAAVIKMLAVNVPMVAVAIAGKPAIKPGAVILQENFQDVKNNATRFWVVGQKITKPTGQDKTSLVFEIFKNAPGALLSIYAIFASRGLNLSKIESRPTKEVLGAYVFLADVEAHQADPVLRDALRMVRICTPKLKVFGSYPRWQNGL
ncbi:MAG: prephenate dehydratase [Candidatus Wildermuthbacteria bacterium]|nr:prephenate dehydratase [Candidatus Wildermuthbacteria bacterium]